MFGLQKNCQNKSTGFGVIGGLVLFVLGYLFTQLRNKTTFDIKGLNEDRELTREEETLNEKKKLSTWTTRKYHYCCNFWYL